MAAASVLTGIGMSREEEDKEEEVDDDEEEKEGEEEREEEGEEEGGSGERTVEAGAATAPCSLESPVSLLSSAVVRFRPGA